MIGLDPILFAISIDRDDLNRKYLAELSSNEQIIVTTPMGLFITILQLF